MTSRTVTGTVEFPAGSGQPCVGARVVARLYTGTNGGIAYGTVNDLAVGSTATLTNSLGVWTLELEPNSGINPAGTVWMVTITPPDREPVTQPIIVPNTLGPHNFTSLLAEIPGALPPQALASHVADLTAHGLPGGVVARSRGEDIRTHGATHWADSTDAFVDAAAAVVAGGGGEIIIPAGYWGLSEKWSVPNGASTVGVGGDRSAALPTPTDSIGSVIYATSSAACVEFAVGNAFQFKHSGWMFDGASIATSGLITLATNGGLYESVHVKRVVGHGWDIRQTQNAQFVKCIAHTCGDGGFVLGYGAGGNSFYTCQAVTCARHLVLDDTLGTSAYGDTPTANSFDACIFEKCGTGQTVLFDMRKASECWFSKCVWTSAGGTPDPASILVDIGTCDNVAFSSCHFHGKSGEQRLFMRTSAYATLGFFDQCSVMGFENVFDLHPETEIFGASLFEQANTNWAKSGSTSPVNLLRTRSTGGLAVRVPLGAATKSSGSALDVYGPTASGFDFRVRLDGQLQWAGGTSFTADTTLSRSAAGVLASNGAFKPASYTTAGRPSAVTVGAGAMVFDSTLNRPIWSTGTAWVDATGTVV